MRLKKLMAVACAAALTVTAFAGCSKKNDSSDLVYIIPVLYDSFMKRH